MCHRRALLALRPGLRSELLNKDFDLDLMDDSEGEEEDDLGTEKEVSRVPLAGICDQLLTILGQVEEKEKGKGKVKGQSKKHT